MHQNLLENHFKLVSNLKKKCLAQSNHNKSRIVMIRHVQTCLNVFGFILQHILSCLYNLYMLRLVSLNVFCHGTFQQILQPVNMYYSPKKEDSYPYYISPLKTGAKHTINMLLHSDQESYKSSPIRTFKRYYIFTSLHLKKIG